ncbi:MAG TPA: dihydroorotate dehydrogenase electron transfer subunit [Epulopiscium sp.]|nr:dihydroorotate dehydrogenase electron transfer subunit [Candidatus Epulonipiscium sp.]
MKMTVEIGIITSNELIASDVYSMTIKVPDIVGMIESPGQFVNIYPKEKHTILPRPISLCEVDSDNQSIRIIYAVVGDGTYQFSKMAVGDEIQVSGPSGNGFDMTGNQPNHLIVGGGVGVPPLVELAKRLKGNLTVVLGFRDEPYLIEEFEKLGATVYVATESGKVGHKGNVIDILNAKDIKIDMAYSCGPKPMLKALNTWCEERELPVQVSLEERMACGIGVCVGCVCKKKDETAEDGWDYKKTCTDGPVFMGSDVIWND